MKKLFLAASVAAALMAAGAPAAHAATSLHITQQAPDGSFTASFEGNSIAATTPQNPLFQDIFHWTLDRAGTMSAALTSIFAEGASTGDINFTSVTINGHEFSLSRQGRRDNGFLDDVLVQAGQQEMIVRGTSNGNGSYGGVLSFAAAQTGGVPEPASWALMIVGFGGIGATLRGKRRQALAA